MAATALVAAGASLLGNAINDVRASANTDEAYRRQMNLMRLQQQYAVENYERQVSYNNPKAQMQRLKDAGLNPNLVYNSGSVGAQAPQISAPSAPSAPVAPSVPSNYASVFNDAVAAAAAMAQAKKAGSEAIAQDIENKYASMTLAERVNAVGLHNNWTRKQIENVAEQTSLYQQQFASITADLNLKQLDSEEKKKRLAKLDSFLTAELQAFRDKHNLSAFEYRQAQSMSDDVLRKLKSEADMLELNYQLTNKYAETEKNLGILGTIIGWLIKFAK